LAYIIGYSPEAEEQLQWRTVRQQKISFPRHVHVCAIAQHRYLLSLQVAAEAKKVSDKHRIRYMIFCPNGKEFA